MRFYAFCFCLLFAAAASAQTLAPLTVNKIMRDPRWMGSQPSSPFWSANGAYLFFNWNPDNAPADSLYYITLADKTPRKTTPQIRRQWASAGALVYNAAYTAYAFVRNGDVFYTDKTGTETRVTQTTEPETSPQFIEGDTKLVYNRAQNLYAWDPATGATVQLTSFIKALAPRDPPLTAQDRWLQSDAVRNSDVLRDRKARREAADKWTKAAKEPEPKSIYIEDKNPVAITISPDARFVTYRLTKPAPAAKTAVVPSYVTESGFTTDIPTRTKVGAPEGTSEFYVYDRVRDTVLLLRTDSLPGITDSPDYLKDYPAKDSSRRKAFPRAVTVYGPYWNSKSTAAVVEIRSSDNKDRWLMRLDAATAKLQLIDRQRDEAWIDGPGISNLLFGRAPNIWINNETIWYQSEATGYSHLYTANVFTGEKKQLTSGAWEVQRTQLSRDRKTFYLTTNQPHPGEQQLYKLPVGGGSLTRLTTTTGAHQVSISPSEDWIADLYSYTNKPWELYLVEAKTGKSTQLTNKAESPEFKSYAWKDPEIITITASDGQQVYARLFKPATPHPSKPAVIFVHGAGYLQDAHKWWSTYFREYMFNNLLADAGYTVLDMDYRGSAGYGRNWRTGIYRHMGGKDLSDEVDGAKYLVGKLGVNPKNIGIYGGSYGGFITLMAMFKEGDVFHSGAGLRSVVNWANYNGPYTSDILNEPYNDSIAYNRSSPIYYANGLKGNLLLCHGMVDVNVHFQDIVQLTQRLIELGKKNWELAVYPMEDHGFVEPSSWTDEYNRVFKLFESTLKQ